MSSIASPELIDEIIVTARRIPEPAFTVPLAIDTVIRDELGASGVESLQSLIARAPGLYFESAWGGIYSTPNLRGQQLISDSDLRVGIFVDGVYQAGQAAVDAGTLDLERIEIARGPQSTQYGHSTFAGAIHFVSRAPTEIPESGLTVETGSDAYRAVDAYASGPLFDGALLGRFAAGLATFDGTQANSASGGNGLGGWGRTGAVLSLATPNDASLQASLKFRYSRRRAAQPAASALTYEDYNCGAVEPASGAWSYYCDAVPVRDDFDISTAVPDSENEVLQGTLLFSLPLRAGWLDSQTSLYRSDSDSYRDFDLSSSGQAYGVCTIDDNCTVLVGTPRTVNRLTTANEVSRSLPDTRELSQDLRWRNDDDGRLRWMLGASAWWTDTRDETRFGAAQGDLADDERLTAVLPGNPMDVGPVSLVNLALVMDPNQTQEVQQLDLTERRTLAVFGAIDYSITLRWRARAELRATWERRQVDNRIANFEAGFGTAIGAQDFRDVTPRLSLQYEPSEAWNLYLSAAKGSQSGGINPVPGLLPNEQVFEPEYNWTWELAGRYRNPAHDLGMQATLYYIDWRDAQMLGFPDSPGITNLITRNIGGIITRGLEVSSYARLLPTLRAELDFSYADPSFRAGSDDPGSRRFCGISATNTTSTFCTVGPARDGIVTALVPYVDGNLPPRTPRTMWHTAIVYEAPVSRDGGRFVFRVDANGQGDVFDRAIEGARFGARHLLDARLSYSIGNWSIDLWGRNLGDTQYVRMLASRGQIYFPTTPRPLDMIYGDGRRVGISVSFASSRPP